jgi:hypothetical protein
VRVVDADLVVLTLLVVLELEATAEAAPLVRPEVEAAAAVDEVLAATVVAEVEADRAAVELVEADCAVVLDLPEVDAAVVVAVVLALRDAEVVAAAVDADCAAAADEVTAAEVLGLLVVDTAAAMSDCIDAKAGFTFRMAFDCVMSVFPSANNP